MLPKLFNHKIVLVFVAVAATAAVVFSSAANARSTAVNFPLTPGLAGFSPGSPGVPGDFLFQVTNESSRTLPTVRVVNELGSHRGSVHIFHNVKPGQTPSFDLKDSRPGGCLDLMVKIPGQPGAASAFSCATGTSSTPSAFPVYITMTGPSTTTSGGNVNLKVYVSSLSKKILPTVILKRVDPTDDSLVKTAIVIHNLKPDETRTYSHIDTGANGNPGELGCSGYAVTIPGVKQYFGVLVCGTLT